MTSIARNGAMAALVVSGILGFWIGFRCFPTWHVAVESAQVIAGIVRYPVDNPFYIYHVKLWTVMHELLALGLRAGFSETALSRFTSGVLGMVSLQALAMCVYALARDAAYAVAASLVIFLGAAAEFGGTYPIDLMGTSHTYGAIGLSSVVLTAGLLGSGALRTGGFMLGFMPAIHPSIGIWGGTIAALTVFAGRKRFVAELRPALPWFLLGGAATTISLLAHLWNARGVPAVPAAIANQYLDAYVELWDVHRRAPDIRDLTPYLRNASVQMTFAVVPISAVWLWAFGERLSVAARFLVRFIATTALLAIAVMAISLATGGWLPPIVQILMPLRILNIVGMMCAPLLFGAVGAARDRLLGAPVLAFALTAGLLVGYRSRVPIDRGRYPWIPLGGGPLMVIAIVAIALTLYAVADRRRRGTSVAPQHTRLMTRVRAASAAAFAAGLLMYWAPTVITDYPIVLAFADWRHDPVFSVAAQADGLLATGDGLHLMQLRTRRPVLVDGGGIDGIVYSAGAAPAMERIVRDVYGIDLFHPTPEEHYGAEPISATVNRRNWEQYSRERWAGIRRSYNVTQLLTPADWRVDLPIAAESAELKLYRIPE